MRKHNYGVQDHRVSGSLSPSVAELDRRLRAVGSPQRAIKERAYLKSSLQHLGTGMPSMRRITRNWVREQPVAWDLDQLLAAAGALWEQPTYELRAAAVDLLIYRKRLLDASAVPTVEQMLREAATWALVDPLAIDVIGWIAAGWDGEVGPLLDDWAVDPLFWLRRAAMLSQLRIVRDPNGDPTRFLRYADEMLDEREFFIRKAIGWILREMGRKRPDLVFEWMLPRASRASGVTIREVVKPLTPEQAAAILAARGRNGRCTRAERPLAVTPLRSDACRVTASESTGRRDTDAAR